MNNGELITTKVRKGRPKKPSALEKEPEVQAMGAQGPSQVVPQALLSQAFEVVGADGLRPVPSSILHPGSASTPQADASGSLDPSVGVGEASVKKTRKKSAKTLAKEELIEAEKQLKKAQLEQEQEMRKKALEEIQKLEALKAQLLREEIQKQIEAEAKGEVKRTRKTMKTATADGEKKKTTRKLVKDLMPEPAPVVAPTLAPVRVGEASVVAPSLPPTPGPIPITIKSQAPNPFSMRGGRSYF